MKCALISYHKNASKIYPNNWIDKYRDSIINQTYKDFDIYECDYGAGSGRIFNSPYYLSKNFETFVDCMNFMITHCFDNGYDVVFNTNVDDYYSLDRIEKQLFCIKKGADLVSSNFCLVDENDNITHTHSFDKLNIRKEINRNHNIIAHPSVAYSKRFWNSNKYNPKEIPREDLFLWKRAIKENNFVILPDVLLYHRIHNNSVCRSENR